MLSCSVNKKYFFRKTGIYLGNQSGWFFESQGPLRVLFITARRVVFKPIRKSNKTFKHRSPSAPIVRSSSSATQHFKKERKNAGGEVKKGMELSTSFIRKSRRVGPCQSTTLSWKPAAVLARRSMYTQDIAVIEIEF